MKRHLSLGQKLTLLIGGLLLVAVGLLSAALFQTTRRAATEVAATRLDAATRDLAGLLTNNLPQRLDSTAVLGQRPEVIAAIRHGTTTLPDTLKRLRANPNVVAIALRDSSLRQVFAEGRAVPPFPVTAARALADEARRVHGAAVGELTQIGDSVFYPMIVVVGSRAAPDGYVVTWQRVAGSPAAARQLRSLVGEGTGLVIGNARGNVWTDLVHATSGPPLAGVDVTRAAHVTFDQPGLGSVVAGIRPLPGTPWIVAIEFPRSVVLAPVRKFLFAELIIAGLLIVFGGVAVWLMSRRITEPILQLTAAADRLAAGDLDARVVSDRQDELGRLAAAFNVMADHVAQAAQSQRRVNAELEARVAHRTRDLREANQELEAFSYSVSHDLRAPLRAIDGFSRMVVEDHAATLDAEGRRLLEVIRSNTRRMGALIDDLLEFSRLGRQPLSRVAVDIAELAESVAAEVRASEPQRTLDIRVGPLGRSFGDRKLLHHVLDNLLRNAAKFTRTVAQPVIEVGTRPGLGERVFYVRDNGVGFDPRYAEKLFGVFERLHPADQFEGTGVGLAIVQRIVHRHGGRVWAEGTPGGGATFYFTLPGEEAVA